MAGNAHTQTTCHTNQHAPTNNFHSHIISEAGYLTNVPVHLPVPVVPSRVCSGSWLIASMGSCCHLIHGASERQHRISELISMTSAYFALMYMFLYAYMEMITISQREVSSHWTVAEGVRARKHIGQRIWNLN